MLHKTNNYKGTFSWIADIYDLCSFKAILQCFDMHYSDTVIEGRFFLPE